MNNMETKNQDQKEQNANVGTETAAEEKKRLREEKKRLKSEMKALKKQNKEAGEMEDDNESGGTLSVILITAFIVLIWLAFLCVFVKMDIGGFGSGVLRPILKDVPVVNKILPKTATAVSGNDADAYYGYDNLEDAVKRIKELELELQDAQTAQNEESGNTQQLEAEIKRLKTFEDNQVEFEKIKNEFYNEVVFSDNAPDVEEYKKYYEEIDPTNAELLYKEVVQQVAYNQEIEDYAKAYSSMKPKQAAGIFEAMTDNLDLAAKILNQMTSSDRGNILGAMDPDIAAKLTKLMEPNDN